MSRFFSKKYIDLTPYVPGEQPRGGGFIKLNTNESPFPPSAKALEAARKAAENVNLYSDPSCARLRETAAAAYGVRPGNIICGNGSDELLNFAFMAYCDETHPAVFPDISYGFYPVFALQNRVPFTQIPLAEDLSMDVRKLRAAGGVLFIANPNAPTGLLLGTGEIEELLLSDPARMVVVDEAYIDFGGESAVKLIEKYDNLLVIQTFSKSRSMAGARLGLAFAQESVIADLETLKYSLNPYNVNAVTQAMGVAALEDRGYMLDNCRTVIENREMTKAALKSAGFEVTDSAANFVFAKHPDAGGAELYAKLREKGILVRHFSSPARISDYNRITVGTRDQMEAFIKAAKECIGQ